MFVVDQNCNHHEKWLIFKGRICSWLFCFFSAQSHCHPGFVEHRNSFRRSLRRPPSWLHRLSDTSQFGAKSIQVKIKSFESWFFENVVVPWIVSNIIFEWFFAAQKRPKKYPPRLSSSSPELFLFNTSTCRIANFRLKVIILVSLKPGCLSLTICRPNREIRLHAYHDFRHFCIFL